jgi:hypothetical protein
VEPYQVDVLTFAVLGDLQQIQDSEETGFACKLMRDVGQANGLNRVDFNFTFVHAVATTHGYMWARPDSDRARDLSAADSVTKSLHECHIETLRSHS